MRVGTAAAVVAVDGGDDSGAFDEQQQLAGKLCGIVWWRRQTAELFDEQVAVALQMRSRQIGDSRVGVPARVGGGVDDRAPSVAGTHVTSLGADEPGKVDLDPDLLAAALVVTDDQRLGAAIVPHVDTSLSRVLRGEHPGRQSNEQITVYSPMGLPLQDCVAAWHAYQGALALGLGTLSALES